jgi:stage II sporulation protein D
MRALVIGLCVAVVVSSCAAPTTIRRPAGLPEGEPDIRVLLAEGAESVRISTDEGLTVSAAGIVVLDSPGRCAVVLSGRSPRIEVTLEPSGNVAVAQGDVAVSPRGNSSLSFDGVSYAGYIRALLGPDGGLMLVNTVPIETYLEGVLPHEMGDPGVDGYDALKSQAVAARTYALERTKTHSADPFDVYAGVQDQVYRGLKGRTKHASSAIRDTRGVVLKRGKELASTYYCACCGGHTSDIRQVWPKREPADYLFGVPDHEGINPGAFCADYKNFRWRYSFTGKELGDMLRKTLPARLGVERSRVGAVLDISIEGWTPSGRVRTVVIRTTKGEYRIAGDEIRWILMADPKQGRILPSIMFNFDKVMEGDRLAFLSIAGGGNGHGVGMCQNGAIAMARKGYTYQMILSHYYPRCDVVKAY